VSAANPEDAARVGVRRLWDEITPPFDWGVAVTDGKAQWQFEVFAGNASEGRESWPIVVGP
jgi:hypothetical protein